MVKSSFRISSLLAALCMLSGTATAAGLGRLSVQSALGQPLRAEIELLSVAAEEAAGLEARMASAEAFRAANLVRAGVIPELNLVITKRADGRPVLRITSASPVSDPFVDLLIELTWSSGRILREYTVLLDPLPDNRPAEAATPVLPVASQPAAAAATEAAVAPPRRTTRPAVMEAAHYGPVKPGETLRDIAMKVNHPDVTLDMMIASLYQANQDAFIQGNLNLLKEGKVLRVPDRDTVMRTFSPHQARQLLREHSQSWQDIRGRVAGQAAQTVAEADGQAAGKGRVAVAQPPAPVAPEPPRDVLRLSKGGPLPADASLAERQRELEEELAARSRALQEALDRVSQLESTVQDLQRLMALQAGEPAKTATAPAKAPVQLPAEQPGFLRSLLNYPLYLGGAVAALALGVLAWVLTVGRRRRRNLSGFEQSAMTGGDAFKFSSLKTGTGSRRTGATQPGSANEFSRLGLGSIDTHEVDPIAEADVYLAYHRDAQAEEILKEALAKNPGRHEIALKLLEIYATRRDAASFGTRAQELRTRLGNPVSPLWAKAAELGRGIDPGNPLYRASETAEPAEAPSAAEPPMEFELSAVPAEEVEPPAPEAPDAEAAGAPPRLDFSGIDLELADVGREEAAAAPAEARPDEMDAKLDLARACIDMGDLDGARAILDEVFAKGSDQQRQAAEALLASLQG